VNPDVLSLSQELAEITRLVEDDDLEASLARYIRRLIRTVPGCDQASISVLDGDQIETVAGVSDRPSAVADPTGASRRSDAAEAGPIMEALRYGEPRRLPDVSEDQRWPQFAARLVALGLRSALVLPIASRSEPAAALTLYSRQPNQFVDTSYDVVLVFALHAGVVFDNAALYQDSQALVTQLRDALRTRSTIGQAQGLLMHRYGYQSDQAFEALRKVSQNHNVKLRQIAQDLVAAHGERRLEQCLTDLGLVGPG
jgi:GAF domain-containing protein